MYDAPFVLLALVLNAWWLLLFDAVSPVPLAGVWFFIVVSYRFRLSNYRNYRRIIEKYRHVIIVSLSNDVLRIETLEDTISKLRASHHLLLVSGCVVGGADFDFFVRFENTAGCKCSTTCWLPPTLSACLRCRAVTGTHLHCCFVQACLRCILCYACGRCSIDNMLVYTYKKRNIWKINWKYVERPTTPMWGGHPGQVLSGVILVWSTHRGGMVPRVYTERSDRPWVTLNLCVMRRYCLGEGDLVSTKKMIKRKNRGKHGKKKGWNKIPE